ECRGVGAETEKSKGLLLVEGTGRTCTTAKSLKPLFVNGLFNCRRTDLSTHRGNADGCSLQTFRYAGMCRVWIVVALVNLTRNRDYSDTNVPVFYAEYRG